jgi:hypothetical protein
VCPIYLRNPKVGLRVAGTAGALNEAALEQRAWHVLTDALLTIIAW